MDGLFDQDFFNQLKGLKMRTGNTSQSGLSGLRKSDAKGNSVEFSDFREYILGDDIRRLDWNAYARLGKLYMKLYLEEREGIFTIFLDLTRSMEYGEPSKKQQALRVAAAICYMVLNHQDRVRLVLVGVLEAGSPFLPVQSFHGSASFYKVLELLQRIGEKPGLVSGSVSLSFMAKKTKPPLHGTSIIISDFFPDGSGQGDGNHIEELIKYLRLYRKQSVQMIQVLSQDEREPKFGGTQRLIDMESGEDVRMTLSLPVIKAYQRSLNQFQDSLVRVAKQYQCHYQLTLSSDSLVQFLYRGMNQGWQHI